MSLINRIRQKAQEQQQEQQLENRDRLREMTNDTKEVTTGHFRDKGMTENEILDLLKFQILNITPIYGTILSSKVIKLETNISAYCDGKYIYIGKKFFDKTQDEMIHILLNLIGKLITGMYMKPSFKTYDKDYTDFVRYVYLTIIDMLVTTMMIKHGNILGYKKDIETSISKEYIRNKMSNLNISGVVVASQFSALKTQNFLEDNLQEDYEKFRALDEQSGKFLDMSITLSNTVLATFNIRVPADALLKARELDKLVKEEAKLKAELEKLESLRRKLKSKLKEGLELEEKKELKEGNESSKIYERLQETSLGNDNNVNTGNLMNNKDNEEVENIQANRLAENKGDITSWGDLENSNKEDIELLDEPTLGNISTDEFYQTLLELTSNIPPEIYQEWYTGCEKLGAYLPEFQMNVLRDIFKKYGYKNSDVQEFLKALPSLKDNEELLELVLKKMDLDREDSLFDKDIKKVRDKLKEFLGTEDQNILEDKSLAEVVEDINNRFINELNKEDNKLEENELEENISDLSDLKWEDSSQEDYLNSYGDHSVDNEQDEEYIDNEFKLENTEINSLDLSKTDDINSTGKYEEIDINETLDNLNEEIEKLEDRLEQVKELKNEKDLNGNDNSATELYSSEQEVSDVKDIFNDLEITYDSPEYEHLLDNMTLTRKISGEYIKVNKNWIKELEGFMQIYLPNRSTSFQRPNKKFVHSKIMLPSKSTPNLKSSIDNLNVFCDISGSMTDRDVKVLKGVLSSGEKAFPKKTKAYGFNHNIRELKYNNGKLREDLDGSGGTHIRKVLEKLEENKLSGKSINVIITDGGFNWNELQEFMNSNRREIIVLILTTNYNRYKDSIKSSRSRYKIIDAELYHDGDTNKIKSFN